MGLSLRPLGRKIVDVFSADTEEDQRKRMQAGQPRFYADQQRAMGNNRPATNVGAAFLGNTARFANTVKGGGTGAYGLGRLGISSMFGDDEDYRATLSDVTKDLKKEFAPNSGLFGAGTLFDDYEEASNPIKPADFTQKIVAGGAGVAGEVLPVGKGVSVAKQGLKIVPRLAAEGAAIGAAGTAGDEFIRTGKVDPANVAVGAAFGGASAALPPLAATGGKQVIKGAKELPRVAAKADEVAFTPRGETRLSLEDRDALEGFIDVKRGIITKPSEQSAVLKNAHAAAKRQGIELYDGKNVPADKVEQFLTGRKQVNQGGYLELPTVAPKEPGDLRITEKFSPDRGIRTVTNKIEEGANKAIYNASVSENPIVRNTARLIQGISREAGTPEALKQAKRRFKGKSELGKVRGADLAEAGRKLPTDSRTRVWATIDTDQAAKTGMTVDPSTLTPEEQGLRQQIVDSIEETTKGNFERGLISEEQAGNPNYLKRAYEPFEGSSDKAVEDSTRRALLKQFKGRKDVSEELINKAITDPSYLAGKKAAQSHQAWALVDYSNFLDSNGYTSDIVKPGFVQLPDSALYGAAQGKWVPKNIADDFTGFQYTNATLNAVNDILTAYDQLGIRRAKKQLLTVFNPAVRLGNQVSNRMFATLNGLNPLEYEVTFQNTKGMIKNRHPLYIEAVEQGLTGSDATQADFAKNIAQYVDDPEILKNSGNWAQRTYSQADDRARLAAYSIHRSKGYTPEQAARLTQRGFQDYSSVGFFYDLAAKTPFVGNAFVRFAGDSMRIGKNALVDHPLRATGLVATWATLSNAMSKLSGETPEDKQTREDRFGAPKIPFTDISLTTQTPWGEVNVARFLPFYNLNEVGSEVSRFSPVQASPVKFKDGKPSLDVKNFQDPLLGQVAQMIFDEDFRGKSIQDPENTEYAPGVKKYTELSGEEKNKNRGRFLANQNIPFGREIDAIASAAKGKPDVYGKERSLPQAILRAGGVKVEKFGPEQAKKTRDINKFFEGNVERTEQFVKDNPDLKDAYYKFKSPTIDRKTSKKASDLVTPERWKIVSADRSGKLFEFLKSEALLQEKDEKRPIDPVFKIPSGEQVKQVLDLRSRPTGEDIETEEVLRATQDWYTKFEKAESDYYKKNSAYYSKLDLPDTQNARVKEYGAITYPEQTGLIKKYYQTKTQNADAGKQFYKDNADALSKDFQTYKKARLDFINSKRKIEGFPPISADAFNNVTFGFEEDEQKVLKELSFKFGGSGSSGSYKPSAGSAYEHAVSLSAGGSAAKPKVSAKKSGGVKSVAKKTAKPKVSIKKSLV